MREGRDGRQYFDFYKGAVYQFYEREKGQRGKPTFCIRISACTMTASEQEEYELEKIEEEAIPFRTYSTEEFLEFLEAGFAEEIETGQPEPLPVTAAETKWYYSAKRKQRREARAAADKKLIGEQEKDSKGKPKLDKTGKEIWNGGNAEYRELLKEQERLERRISRAIAEEQDYGKDADRYREVCTRRKELIEKSGIRIELYQPEPICPICKNKGVDEQGRVCVCAMERSEKIVKFCAGERLRKRLSETWLNHAELDTDGEEEAEEDGDNEVAEGSDGE